MNEHEGWILDVFPHPQDGLVLYFLTVDGRRLRVYTPFPVTFYLAGTPKRLVQAQRFLHHLREECPGLRTEARMGRDLFLGPRRVLAVQVPHPSDLAPCFRKLQRTFPDLDGYNVDIPPALRVWARTGAFPLAHCRLRTEGDGRLVELEPLSSPWELFPLPPPLRILHMYPDGDPEVDDIRAVHVRFGHSRFYLPLDPRRRRRSLLRLVALLREFDPDVLLTAHGDAFLLPRLIHLGRETGVEIPWNREPAMPPVRRSSRTYRSYGRVVHRPVSVILRGRLHIDVTNAPAFGDGGLEAILETARVTGLPVQVAARTTPGTGISAMQILEALRRGILVPWRKGQAEAFRDATHLFRADQGGLIYRPISGVHEHVAELDFTSMYPAIMVRFNLSPETVGPQRPGARRVPELDLWVSPAPMGLIPGTLRPLLEKRLALKRRLSSLAPGTFAYRTAKAQAAAHKRLLVTCFGYLGYRNARFGRIEAHQAVTAYGREALLRAKEAAEEKGYRVLHMMVDGLWIQGSGPPDRRDLEALVRDIEERTGLPILLEGVYRWIVFTSSRVDPRVPVPTRYFGVFQDGTIKARGIMARRSDTPPFVARAQMGLLEILSKAPDLVAVRDRIPEALAYLRDRAKELRQGKVPLSDLVVTVTVSREASEYRGNGPVARAARMLDRAGHGLRPGQRLRFIYIRRPPGVWPWTLRPLPKVALIHVERYLDLLLRAAAEILEPLGVPRGTMRTWVRHAAQEGLPLVVR